MKRGISIMLALLCASCAPLSAGMEHFADASPLCTLVGNEQVYAGQRVLARGLLVQTPHGRHIYSPECEPSAALSGSSETWDRHARQVVEGAFANNERARVPIVVSGIFQPWTRYENGHMIIHVGGPYIEQARIVAARQPDLPPSGREPHIQTYQGW